MIEYTATLIGDEPIRDYEAAKHVHALPGDDEENAIILRPIISAAREYCENYTGRAFARQRVCAYPEGIGGFALPRAPVISIESVKYFHNDGSSETLTEADYNVRLRQGIIVLRNPLTRPREFEPIAVTYIAGYSKLPDAVRQAMLMLIGHWIQHKECIQTGAVTSVEIEMTTKAILRQYKRWWF